MFGNIEFVGELFKRQMVTDNIMIQIFTSLLGNDQGNDDKVNDNTIEAALKLMTMLGLNLE